VLTIDTATEVCGVGLLLGNGSWFEYTRKAGLNHAGVVLETVHCILSDAGVEASQIDLVVCSQGPGSFTGLRIGMATAKGFAAGARRPLVSVPTLDALAFGLEWTSRPVLPVIDAKKNRVYTAVYKHGKRIRGPLDFDLHAADTLVEELGEVVITGPGATLVADRCKNKEMIAVDTRVYASNRAYAELGIRRFKHSGSDEIDAGPVYLRKSDAELALDNGA